MYKAVSIAITGAVMEVDVTGKLTTGDYEQFVPATELGSNATMMHVFHKSGLEVHSSLQGGAYSLKMPFPLADQALPSNV